jgi:dihydrofolate synthase/folylpolyglutamate synthase
VRYDEALAYLDAHSSFERTGRVAEPSLHAIRVLCDRMGHPEHAYRSVHVTGTNGKGSTVQIVSRLLEAHHLRVGAYTSPHLERINERISIGGAPISDEVFAHHVAAVADLEVLGGVTPSFFEIMTAVALRWFADEAVDAAVVEVGMLGRWDATNVVDSHVAAVTNIALDHTEYAGPTLAHIAAEKAGIIKPASTLVLGDVNEDLRSIFLAETASRRVLRGDDYDCERNDLAVGGRLLDVRTPRALHQEVSLPLHGAHQGVNATTAICAAEEFFDAPVSREVLDDAMSRVQMPGRFEVVRRRPLVVLDGAHNPAGAETCAEVFFDDFSPAERRILVTGSLRSRDPEQMLLALRADECDLVIACTPPSPRGMDAEKTAQVARRLGCERVLAVPSVARACDTALADAGEDDAVLITGSLYVVGSARAHLRP